MNWLGLIPWTSARATGNLAVTAALALFTFVLTQIAGIRAAGLVRLPGAPHRRRSWVLWPMMIPVEILGLFTKPFALTVRLFANMLAGHIVIFFLSACIFISASASPRARAMAMGIDVLELFVGSSRPTSSPSSPRSSSA